MTKARVDVSKAKLPKKPITACAYQGGKTRFASKILDIIDLSKCSTFFDMCCGSGAISIELVNRGFPSNQIVMIDAGPWGIFWNSIGTQKFNIDKFKIYCDAVPKNLALVHDFIKELSTQPANIDTEYVFLLLQATSFGGKAIWIENNKWMNTTFRNYWLPTETSNRRSPVNPMQPLPEALFARVKLLTNVMKGVTGFCENIYTLNVKDKDAVIYLDPPYKGTTQYGHNLDLESLIKTANVPLYVSEGVALSNNARCISFGEKKGGISGDRQCNLHQEWLSIFNKEEKES